MSYRPSRTIARAFFCIVSIATIAIGTVPLRAQAKSRDEHWREEIRKTLFVPSPLPKLDARSYGTFSPTADVIAERVTYSTASGMRVPAIIYRPATIKKKLPGIVVVNGHGSDKFGWYAFYSGVMFARAGTMVVTYDLLGEGERNSERKSRTGAHDKIVDTPHWGQRLSGLMITDLEQAVSYLAQRPEVDAKRIGVVGYSLGAFVSGITGAIDPRIHALVLSGGGNYDGPDQYFDNSRLPCQGPPYQALRKILGDDRPAVLYTLNADRGATYIMNGLADEVVDIPHHGPDFFRDLRKRVLALHGSPKNIFETVFYSGISHRTSWVDRDGVLWLNKQLHFANWSEADIKKAPLTHISEWARANNVDITKAYIQENREGGLMAVGSGIPAIQRADLMVLSEEQWQQQKNTLTYEAWAEKTLAAEKGE